MRLRRPAMAAAAAWLSFSSVRRCSSSARATRSRTSSSSAKARRLQSSVQSSSAGWTVLKEASSASFWPGHSYSCSGSCLTSFFGLTRRRKREGRGDAARRDAPMRRPPLPLRGTGRPELRRGGVLEEVGAYLDGVLEEEEFPDKVVAVDIRRGVQ